MAELPSGTVTFLFTDIEGSTALWEHHPEPMRTALVRHDALLAEGIEGHSGVVVKSRGEGDSVFAVFARASDAVVAAADLQRALQGEPWPTPAPLRVRMALHTGEAELREGDYYGAAVNRCARLRGIGHGGQPLLSEATAVLVRDALPEGASLHDLGEYRLRDLARPERVFQLLHPDLPADFPPLASLDARPHNLPVQPTALIGRERELDALRDLLLREEVRLLTLTGPGGTGKTRLGLQLAADLLDHFEDGACFVPLAPISDPSLVASTVAQTLGIREVGGGPILDSLKDYLRDKNLLLLLDNFEQILPAAPLVADLPGACPGLKVLVTSRATLHLRGEKEFPVPPLALPDPERLPPVEALSQYASVALFAERARDVKGDFGLTDDNAPAVAEICHRLDGLPLAIELAASRIKLLAPAAMLARLERRLPLLTGGARDLPARQQTLRDTMAWSYDLLDEAEQRLFRRLAVFMGGCPLDAAEAVCNAEGDLGLDVLDGLGALVEQSLARQLKGADGEPRFRMLETVREYGLEQLEASGELGQTRQAHAEHYLALAEAAEPELRGPEQAGWLARLEAEHDNLRAALEWAVERDAGELGARLGAALWRFWSVRGYLTEGRARLGGVLARAGPSVGPATRARVLDGLAHLTRLQGDYRVARALCEQSLAIRRELGDRRGIATSLHDLGMVAYERGDYRAARALYEESLAILRELGYRSRIATALESFARLAAAEAQVGRVARLLGAAESLREAIGTPLRPTQRADYAHAVAAARAELGEEAFAAAWAEGQAMSVEQAIAYALEDAAPN